MHGDQLSYRAPLQLLWSCPNEGTLVRESYMHAKCDSASVNAEMRVLLAGSYQKPLLNARRCPRGVHLPSSVQRRLAIHRLRAVAQPAYVDPTSMESGSSTDGAMVPTPSRLASFGFCCSATAVMVIR